MSDKRSFGNLQQSKLAIEIYVQNMFIINSFNHAYFRQKMRQM